jgi:FkbM family methyltransferase
MKAYVQGRTIRVNSKILKIILNRINHSIARKNLQTNPQLVIFSFDHIGLSLNLEGRYENSPLILVEEFIEKKIPTAKDKTVLDIGANIGNHSIFFANKFKNVYAFEPNPVTYEVLKINCTFAAEQKNITTVNVGLSDKEGSLPFYINRSNIGGSQIIDVNHKSSKDTIQINVKTLDQLIELKDASVALVKIDVEGHELNVLKGAKDTISRNMPAILFEQSAS